MQTFTVMGIVNLTPDSFYDGGRYQSIDAACQQAETLLAQGADLIDIGGESTRPGANTINADQELARIMPVIERLQGAPISVDTSKPVVMREVLRHGVKMINDVNALQAQGAIEAVRSADCQLCLMHRQGEPAHMQDAPHYRDVVSEVLSFLKARVAACQQQGIAEGRLVLDPGIGFGKSDYHNLSLLKSMRDCVDLGYQWMIAVSRKSMIGRILDRPVTDRLVGSVALAVQGYLQGATWFRVHDVKETVEALRMVEAVSTVCPPESD